MKNHIMITEVPEVQVGAPDEEATKINSENFKEVPKGAC